MPTQSRGHGTQDIDKVEINLACAAGSAVDFADPRKDPMRSATTLDALFVAALLGVLAVVLLPLRGSLLLENPYVAIGLVILLPAALTAAWCAFARQPRTWAWPTKVPIPALALAALTYFAFYLPLRIHFWGGGDEHIALSDIDPLPSFLACDVTLNRPFTMLPALVGQFLAPHRIDGFLWLGVALVWATGFLLHRIVRELSPGTPLLSVAAGALLIVDRSDAARFFVLWASDYYLTALALTLLAIWLFLHSERTGSRGLLPLACGTLVIALLTNEGGYPLAGLALGVAAFRGERPRRWIWVAAWAGTIAVVSARFVLFLRQHGAEAYQSANVADAMREPGTLLDNLALHAATLLSYFDFHGALRHHWPWALGAFGFAVVAVLTGRVGSLKFGRDTLECGGLTPLSFFVERGTKKESGLKPPHSKVRSVDFAALASYPKIAIFAGVAMLFGMLPFLHMAHSFRAEFFAGPGKAVLVATLLCVLVLPLRRFGAVPLALAIGLLAANATAEATARQLAVRSASPVSFETTTHFFRQLHALGDFEAETVILVFLDDPDRSPLGVSYGAFMLGKELLGTKILVANDRGSTPLPMTPVFGPDSVSLPEGPSKRLWPGSAAYDQIVAVAVGRDGGVRLLDRLPSEVLPAESQAYRYDPARRMRPGPFEELPFLHYPTWARRLHDVFDPADGVVLADGWGSLESQADGTFRQIDQEAGLIVNPLGQSRREIRLSVRADDAGLLEASDAEGQVLATAGITGGEIVLDVPMAPDRPNRLRLRVIGSSTAFQVLVPRRESKSAKKTPSK
jgi:hypothetical protein